MFSYFTPEMINLINENRKKNIPTFEEYYNKRYLEECKAFFEKPKFSMKYMMIMAHLKEVVRNQCLKEYKQKYPWASIENNKREINKKEINKKEIKTEPFDTDFVILDNNEDINNDKNINNIKHTNNSELRRSKRLQNKN